MAHLDETEQKHADAIKEIGKKLYACGWKKLYFNYSGYGDSCSDLDFTIENEEGTQPLSKVSASELPPDFSEDKLVDHFLELLPSGFENNEGGSGEVVLDTRSGVITVHHTAYYTESEDSEWTL